MIQPGTNLVVQDNSGGRFVKVIRILKKKKTSGSLGDFVVVSVQLLKKKGRIKIKKKEVCLGLITKTKSPFFRKNGFILKNSSNSCILLNKQLKPYGTRIFGTVSKELRNLNQFKLLAISADFI